MLRSERKISWPKQGVVGAGVDYVVVVSLMGDGVLE